MVIEYSYRDIKSIKTRLNEVLLQEGGKWVVRSAKIISYNRLRREYAVMKSIVS